MCAAYKSDNKAIPVYAILFVGNVGNPFPANFLIFYIQNGVMMRVSDALDIFVGVWEYKKVFLNIFMYI